MMDKTAAQAELLYNRLIKRYRHLKKWARRTGTNAYRLYDRDIPEIPLVLDLYNDAVSGALYRRPYEKEAREEETWLLAMKAAVSRALNIPENRIFLKERRRMKGEDGNQYEKMSGQNFYLDVSEADLSFRVNLSDYLDTGLFLDARKKRALIRAEAAGKRVLNLFAYTCSLSVAAAKGSAKGGALHVDSVDLSKTYLDWGRINFALNGLKAGYTTENSFQDSDCFTLIRSDVILFLSQALKERMRWDMIILDPPSFSNSKKMRGTLDIQRDHKELISKCLSLLSPGGKLWFSTNARGFRFENSDFPGFIIKDMAKELEDEDFRGKRSPLCCTFSKQNGNP